MNEQGMGLYRGGMMLGPRNTPGPGSRPSSASPPLGAFGGVAGASMGAPGEVEQFTRPPVPPFTMPPVPTVPTAGGLTAPSGQAPGGMPAISAGDDAGKFGGGDAAGGGEGFNPLTALAQMGNPMAVLDFLKARART